MTINIDETARKISAELHIDPLKAKYMVKAYEIPQVRAHFINKCCDELDGGDPLSLFCKKCPDCYDGEVRDTAYHWMGIVEDVGPSRMMFSIR